MSCIYTTTVNAGISDEVRGGLMGRLFCMLVMILVMGVQATRVALAEELVLSAAAAYPYSTADTRGFADRIVREAFRRVGISVRVLYASSERSLVNADEGVVDGEYLRIAGLEGRYPNLVMVPVAISEYEFVAFARRGTIRIRGWESLKPYNVGYINGWKILEENVKGVKSLTRVKGDEALFELLRNDRADVVIFERRQGEAYLKRTAERKIVAVRDSLARRKMYLYLNRKHASLVPRLAESLRRMRQDGTMQRIAADF